jgi:hypothetical protein
MPRLTRSACTLHTAIQCSVPADGAALCAVKQVQSQLRGPPANEKILYDENANVTAIHRWEATAHSVPALSTASPHSPRHSYTLHAIRALSTACVHSSH